MGMILLKYGLRVKRLPLLESNGFGRSPEFGMRSIPVKNLPLFWLEVRWISGQWAWRALNLEDETRGKGALLPHGWKTFHDRIYFRNPNVVLLELFDDGPPEVMIESLSANTLIPVSEFQGLHIGDAGYRVDRSMPLLSNGDSFVWNGGAYRLWIPQNYAPSIETTVLLSDPLCRLDIYPNLLKATFSLGRNSISLQGELVRMLLVYARERLNGEGWVESTTALDAWVAAGGNANSDVARVSWERNKIRKQLLDQSVLGVDHLFDRFRQGTVWSHRLNLHPKQVSIIES